ncbi:SRPBCC family protein [Micromonospora sonneratiae]|uniref:SRPBCC domain-containing protein n=1 Tax=Micromonospora sonneratiae TaxID=1184706 RepID=A0ABW3Y6B7_9ACTN
MNDIVDALSAVRRETGHRRIPAGEGRTVVLRRTYNAPIGDVWDAITDADRINRWFLPISGDLRLGGSFRLKGNAQGEILHCDPPHLLKVSWYCGDDPAATDISEVEVRLSTGTGDVTDFELVHSAVVPEEQWAQYGPGATGVGWDLTLLGLGLHLRGGSIEEPDTWGETAEAREFMTRSSQAWGAAYAAAGATDAEVASAVGNTTGFYVPDLAAAQGGDAGH